MNRRIAKKHNKQSEERERILLEIYRSSSPAQRYAMMQLADGMLNKTLNFNWRDIEAGKAFLKAKEQEFAATCQSNL